MRALVIGLGSIASGIVEKFVSRAKNLLDLITPNSLAGIWEAEYPMVRIEVKDRRGLSVPGAEIYVDGKKVGRELRLPPGTHTLSVLAPGYMVLDKCEFVVNGNYKETIVWVHLVDAEEYEPSRPSLLRAILSGGIAGIVLGAVAYLITSGTLIFPFNMMFFASSLATFFYWMVKRRMVQKALGSLAGITEEYPPEEKLLNYPKLGLIAILGFDLGMALSWFLDYLQDVLQFYILSLIRSVFSLGGVLQMPTMEGYMYLFTGGASLAALSYLVWYMRYRSLPEEVPVVDTWDRDLLSALIQLVLAMFITAVFGGTLFALYSNNLSYWTSVPPAAGAVGGLIIGYIIRNAVLKDPKMEPKRQLWYTLLGGGSSFEALMSLIGLILMRNGVAGISDSILLGEIMPSVVIAVVLVVLNLERTRPPASTCDYHWKTASKESITHTSLGSSSEGTRWAATVSRYRRSRSLDTMEE